MEVGLSTSHTSAGDRTIIRHPLPASTCSKLAVDKIGRITGGLGAPRAVGWLVLLMSFGLLAAAGLLPATTYYVSSSTGSDFDDGLTSTSAFETIAKVNSLILGPGDEVRFRCGDVWRGETLIVRDSGLAGSPITFTSDPPGCPNRPVFSGAQPIEGWSLHAPNVYEANLAAPPNSDKFPFGMNQLFRGKDRLPFGRWPNLDAANGGFSVIDSQPMPDRIVDADLPAGSWIGARFHHRSERWIIHSREVTGQIGTTLTLNDQVDCRNGCADWGYFLNNSLLTLDQEGEWYWDEATNRVYLFSTVGAPADEELEGSVLPEVDPVEQAAILLGGAPTEHVRYVTVNNFEIRHWAGSGIQTAVILRDDENDHLTLTGNYIHGVNKVGIWLKSFVFDADVGPNGFRGGQNGLVSGNMIQGANFYGIETFSVSTEFLDNQIDDTALLHNLVRDGMGCPLSTDPCGIVGSGIRISSRDEGWSGTDNTIRHNGLHRVGMVGIDVFGPFNTIEGNLIDQACSTLGEGAGIRTFGGSDFATTLAHDITIQENIVRDTIGNSDGGSIPQGLNRAWGHGIYVDHFSDDVDVLRNTAVRASAYGIQFAGSRGTIAGNTLFDNTQGPSGGPHNRILDDVANSVVSVTDNVFFGFEDIPRPLLSMDTLANVTAADGNYYFKPRNNQVIQVISEQQLSMTLNEWQALSGLDSSAVESFYTLEPEEPRRARLFINDSKTVLEIPLNGAFQDLDQNPVSGTLTLQPFESRVLIQEAFFFDGFETGNTSAWTSTAP